MVLAGAWPWLVGQDLRAGDRSAAGRLGGAGAAGAAVAALVTLGLSAAELLQGPMLPGFSDATSEALVLGGTGAVLSVLAGLRRVFRAPVARSAWSGSQRGRLLMTWCWSRATPTSRYPRSGPAS
ncbi:MAG: hypothetical protein M3R63_00170 [Actinomycetota bacterium]|nr:hypothetical protein [Actinomycetota bacterium]